ncbi:MAG: type III polyketide synthase [Chitinophagaceae bacterium]
MSKIISTGTALPAFKHRQDNILGFMQNAYELGVDDKRKLKFLYHQGGIDTRYSAVPDYSLDKNEWEFYPTTPGMEPFPNLEKRMEWYNEKAVPLAFAAINNCLEKTKDKNITHLITVSCTGMSAPGLDIELMQLLNLPPSTFRTSINFMGCYAAIHALKIADAFCTANKNARVMIVCVELCTLHFQKENTLENLTSSMLFADGAAAVMVSGDDAQEGLLINNFYSSVVHPGKKDMAWELSSKGFLMTLSSYVPALIKNNFDHLLQSALQEANSNKDEITRWCIHPGGRKILEAVQQSLKLEKRDLKESYEVLNDYGNMSSPTILFVLENIMKEISYNKNEKIFGAAFGPGLTMETFILSA